MTATPIDLVIRPRNIAFGRGQQHPRWWLGGDAIASAYHNGMSATFPKGEAFFVESVRRYRDDVPEPLKSQITDFVRQEVMHSREHVAFNRQAADAGYDMAFIDKRVDDSLAIARSKHPVAQLAMTVALEHFTAIFAHRLLADPSILAGAPDEARRMWLWHAIEEVEHKSVAFDTYMHVTRDLPAWKRYMLRATIFWKSSKNFAVGRFLSTVKLLEQDGFSTGWSTKARVLWFLFGKPGALRKVFWDWLAFFRPGFHPWDVDDRALIVAAEAELKGREKPLAEAA